MFNLIIITLRAVRTVFTAEFVTGIVHWFEDAYVREDTPLIGRHVARPNIVHHHYPRYMTRLTWWQSSWDLCIISALLVLVAWACGVLTCAGPGSSPSSPPMPTNSTNGLHRTRTENGRVITFLGQKNPRAPNRPSSRPASHRPQKQPLLHHDQPF